jgi:SET domain
MLNNSFEAPYGSYYIPADNLGKIFSKLDLDNADTLASLYTELLPFKNKVIRPQPVYKKKYERKDEGASMPSPDFEEKIVDALFYLQDEGRYAYIKIRIAPSSIKEAGYGAYAYEKIPKRAMGIYRGVPKLENQTNLYYAWMIKEFDFETGKAAYASETQYCIDAEDMYKSNWTRFVNTCDESKKFNLEPYQIYDNYYYVAKSNIKPGTELFIDYGDEYKTCNLGMKSLVETFLCNYKVSNIKKLKKHISEITSKHDDDITSFRYIYDDVAYVVFFTKENNSTKYHSSKPIDDKTHLAFLDEVCSNF